MHINDLMIPMGSESCASILSGVSRRIAAVADCGVAIAFHLVAIGQSSQADAEAAAWVWQLDLHDAILRYVLSRDLDTLTSAIQANVVQWHDWPAINGNGEAVGATVLELVLNELALARTAV